MKQFPFGAHVFFCRLVQVLVSFVLVLFAVPSMCLDEFKMCLDDLSSVIHAAVTDLDCVKIKDFSRFVVSREVFLY